MDDAAVHDLHEVDVAGGGVADHTVDLDVVDAGVDHGALGLEFLERLLVALVAFGVLKSEGGRRRFMALSWSRMRSLMLPRRMVRIASTPSS